ncbi:MULTISPECIES: alkyl/aryl-sulfatase [Prauserella salsuginis group]|uniref:Alkyl/aryl-sulfatase n=1 Tax=Prauserella salsuginis TaxID=387889 RepID=A0ABW6G3V4_9PSEU|nr:MULTISPECIES: alkyl sulfatase dimerization domain-containing protein [Prauserella salsuginis group]MCR3718363.1 Alkyl sulfatase BDS1, metallo-beta-lactamase superfamily [Prauserella flava]MCR3732933.1 Alkyl sulfatase BDS1, metallo-beta-lactamase superfamily [Prauserella salsuginis]
MTDTVASAGVAAANADLQDRLPFSDTTDTRNADRGFIGTIRPAQVRADDGRVVWDADAWADVLRSPRPDTVNPSLWRQAQLVARHGLYEVTGGIYQVRGLDLSNMTVVEGREGIIVIDPLLCAETAAAALALYRRHRGDRPVTAVIYTHSHADHFGGVRGVITDDDVTSGAVPILAPEGFLEHAVAENVYAGTAMARRAAYMYGAALPIGATGQLGAGLGMTVSTGTVTLIPPTQDVGTTGHEAVLDGVRIVFQVTPGTEAPSEMNFLFPDHGALCMAENATRTLHNLLTLRGAQVRDPHAWAAYLQESIELFADSADVVFASHHWPTWGRDELVAYLSEQRDLYAYQHDQTLRLLNQGYVGTEIAEILEPPPGLVDAWHTHGYYGSISHNVKAVYQRYMGWFDGNPAHLWQHPPEQAGRRYVDAMGGPEALLTVARRAYDEGDFRWAAELTGHLVFAEPGNAAARELQAAAFEQLGFGAENGPWRNFYLTGAFELRHGNIGTPTVTASPDILAQLSLGQIFDSMAIQVDGPRAAATQAGIDWTVTAEDEQHHWTRLSNGVLVHGTGIGREPADARIRVGRSALIALVTGRSTPDELERSGDLAIDGPTDVLARLLGVLDPPDPGFAIVTP